GSRVYLGVLCGLISPVKIAIDIRRVTEFGVGTYTRNVVRALSRLDQQNQYFLLGSPDRVAEIGFLPSNFQTIALDRPDTSLKGYLECRSTMKGLCCDLVHIPHLFWMPRGLRCPYVLTVHDVLEHMYRTRGLSDLRRS